MNIERIATFRSPFKSKFGIPRQSGLVNDIEGEIVFEPQFRNADALRGLDGFSHIWIIWGFSANSHKATGIMVRPPLLGGNEKMGVFATRSPYRPNALGLSSVRIKEIRTDTPAGPVIIVCGADLMDGTPIYDIKPYLPYADAHPDATDGFADAGKWKKLKVVIPDNIRKEMSPERLNALIQILELDPRPHYHNDPQRIYGMPFGNIDVKFSINGDILTVHSPDDK